jgi:hypothetical protein
MCVETQTRFRPCAHTCLQRWNYCSVIFPSDRLPDTGHACRQYKLRYVEEKDSSGKCFQCAREHMFPHENSPDEAQNGITKRKRGRSWLKLLSQSFRF